MGVHDSSSEGSSSEEQEAQVSELSEPGDEGPVRFSEFTDRSPIE